MKNPAGGTGRQARTIDFAVPTRGALRFAGAMRSHSTKMTIGFGDGDPAGVIFYPRAIELAHAAVEEFLRVASIGWDAWFASPDRAFPVRRAEADFFRPMKPGETFAVTTEVEAVAGTSLVFVVAFSNAAGEIAARVRTVHVLVERPSGKPAVIPEEIRVALA